MDSGRRHEITGSQTRDLITHVTASSISIITALSLSLAPNLMGGGNIGGPSWMTEKAVASVVADRP